MQTLTLLGAFKKKEAPFLIIENCCEIPLTALVKVYYFLWSLQLLYYKDPGAGMRSKATTQTAVNNFLGLHRFDAVFQILVGSWTSPAHHEYYANGNVLAWADTMPFR